MLDNLFPLYAAVFAISLFITVVSEKKLIPALKNRAAQPIYTEGPRWHLKKQGTPTMGGLGFVFAITASVALSTPFLLNTNARGAIVSIGISVIYSILNSLVGAIDDLKKLKKKENRGLTPIEKLILQFSLAALFLIARKFLCGDDSQISFSFGSIDLGIFYFPISLITLVGIINFANLTDGIDGLASSVAFSIGVSLLFISTALVEEAAIISAAITGAAVGFLIFNLHPAKIFMGDTGSLFFGALISSAAFMLDNPLISILICGVYCIEGLSVILQVAVFKLTHKRVFKLSPFHHHLEKCGWSEMNICVAAILLSFIFSVPAYILYLP